jgi:hypothetical protein
MKIVPIVGGRQEFKKISPVIDDRGIRSCTLVHPKSLVSAEEIFSSLEERGISVSYGVKEIFRREKILSDHKRTFNVSIISGRLLPEGLCCIKHAKILGESLGLKNDNCPITALVACLLHLHQVLDGRKFIVLSKNFTIDTPFPKLFGTLRSDDQRQFLDAVSGTSTGILPQDVDFVLATAV